MSSEDSKDDEVYSVEKNTEDTDETNPETNPETKDNVTSEGNTINMVVPIITNDKYLGPANLYLGYYYCRKCDFKTKYLGSASKIELVKHIEADHEGEDRQNNHDVTEATTETNPETKNNVTSEGNTRMRQALPIFTIPDKYCSKCDFKAEYNVDLEIHMEAYHEGVVRNSEKI